MRKLGGWQRIGIAVSVIWAVGGPTMADDGMPRECVAMAMQIGTATNSTYVRTSEVTVFFQPPLPESKGVNELSVGCEPWARGHQDWSVYVAWGQNASPPKAYYGIVAQAGSILTNEQEGVLTKTAMDCVRNALSHKSELDDELTDKAKLECHAFARDGGAVDISVFPRTETDEKGDWQ
jgi:hypothetical protein